MRKPRVRTLAGAAALAALLAALLAGAALRRNYNGYCESAGGPLARDELVSSAIAYVLKRYPPIFNISHEEMVRLREAAIRYRSIDHFKRMNPNCCRIIDHDPEAGSSLLMERLNGRLAAIIEVRFRVPYKSRSGAIDYLASDRTVYVENCGRAWK